MTRRCSVCVHMHSGAIEIALITDEPLRSIAERFGTSPPALLRHRQQHMSPATLVSRDAATNRNGGADANRNDAADRERPGTISHAHAEAAPLIAQADADDLDDSSNDWGLPENAGVVTPASKTTRQPSRLANPLQARPIEHSGIEPSLSDLAGLIELAEPAPTDGEGIVRHLKGVARVDDGWTATVWGERTDARDDY